MTLILGSPASGRKLCEGHDVVIRVIRSVRSSSAWVKISPMWDAASSMRVVASFYEWLREFLGQTFMETCLAPLLLPLSGLLAGVKPRVKLLTLVIPYSGNPNVRYDTVFNLGPFNINKSPFRCPYVITPFRVAGRGKASSEIACIGHSALREP